MSLQYILCTIPFNPHLLIALEVVLTFTLLPFSKNKHGDIIIYCVVKIKIYQDKINDFRTMTDVLNGS